MSVLRRFRYCNLDDVGISHADKALASGQAILAMEEIRDDPFDDEVMACLPSTPWSISEDEIAKRRDLRSTRQASLDILFYLPKTLSCPVHVGC